MFFSPHLLSSLLCFFFSPLLSFSFVFTLLCAVPKATISAGAKEYYIKSGSTITLTCIITDSPDPTFVFWYHNDRMINYDTIRGGIQVETKTGAVTTSTLFVTDAQHTDSGNYTCSSADALPTSISVHVLNGKYCEEGGIGLGSFNERGRGTQGQRGIQCEVPMVTQIQSRKMFSENIEGEAHLKKKKRYFRFDMTSDLNP